MANARKLMARLEAHAMPMNADKPRTNIGTSEDACFHAPPRTIEWKRIEREMKSLREHLWHGASRVATVPNSTKVRNPEALEDQDVAGALSFAVNRNPEKALAVHVYMFAHLPSYAEHHQESMRVFLTVQIQALAKLYRLHRWSAAIKKDPTTIDRMIKAVLEEFGCPPECPGCNGLGEEVAGPRLGDTCSKCGGSGRVECSANSRTRMMRVRRADWKTLWSKPYLFLLDKLTELEREGANLHSRALGEV